MGLSSYYRGYLLLHQNVYCRRLHFIGQWFTILFTVIIFKYNLWYGLPLIPFVIYPFAWSGHYFFEKNKPAAFNNPIKAKICDWIMFKDVLIGRIKIW